MEGRFEGIVCVVLVNNEGQVYTARMKRSTDNRLAHDNERHFIGGEIGMGESPEEAATRHMLEKAGVSVVLEEALTIMIREESLRNGGMRTVASYWFRASLMNNQQPEINPSSDIEHGLWSYFEELVGSSKESFGDVAWGRTPGALLAKALPRSRSASLTH